MYERNQLFWNSFLCHHVEFFNSEFSVFLLAWRLHGLFLFFEGLNLLTHSHFQTEYHREEKSQVFSSFESFKSATYDTAVGIFFVLHTNSLGAVLAIFVTFIKMLIENVGYFLFFKYHTIFLTTAIDSKPFDMSEKNFFAVFQSFILWVMLGTFHFAY